MSRRRHSRANSIYAELEINAHKAHRGIGVPSYVIGIWAG
jgi:hypothetical protein